MTTSKHMGDCLEQLRVEERPHGKRMSEVSFTSSMRKGTSASRTKVGSKSNNAVQVSDSRSISWDEINRCAMCYQCVKWFPINDVSRGLKGHGGTKAMSWRSRPRWVHFCLAKGSTRNIRMQVFSRPHVL